MYIFVVNDVSSVRSETQIFVLGFKPASKARLYNIYTVNYRLENTVYLIRTLR